MCARGLFCCWGEVNANAEVEFVAVVTLEQGCLLGGSGLVLAAIFFDSLLLLFTFFAINFFFLLLQDDNL